MFLKYIIIAVVTATFVSSQLNKCDQTPHLASVQTPAEDLEDNYYHLTIDNVDNTNGMAQFIPSQTYVLRLDSLKRDRKFRWFMITAEDPLVDDVISTFRYKPLDVGDLKPVEGGQSRYSERCPNSVENFDNTEKTSVEIHWVSPEKTNKVRIRAMVGENSEVWYTGGNLEIILGKNNNSSVDKPPLDPITDCDLNSEARYEVIFKGQWSRLTHPRHYPTKPDANGYTHMVGASHGSEFTLWAPEAMASEGLKRLVEVADTTELEREIIGNMTVPHGSRTLIRGRRRIHPYMSEPSHSLFRVDKVHHMVSVVVGLKPSPDWFLGTNKFELCTEKEWLEQFTLPLYPWDAGTMDGVSYESDPSMTLPPESIHRVEVGSFNEASPFYQKNLNDLKPFAWLEIRRLNVFELTDCATEGEEEEEGEGEEKEEEKEGAAEEGDAEEGEEGPQVRESRQQAQCPLGEWGAWSPCVPDVGDCGIGAQTRTKAVKRHVNQYFGNSDCRNDGSNTFDMRNCMIEC